MDRKGIGIETENKMAEGGQPSKEETLKECWIDYSASQIPFPNRDKAREFLATVTEEWGFAAIALQAGEKRGYVLLDPPHFEKLLNLWRHIWNDPLGRETRVLIEPGNTTMAYSDLNKNRGASSTWQGILQGVAVVVLAAAIIGQVHGFAKQEVQQDKIMTMKEEMSKLERRILQLEGRGR